MRKIRILVVDDHAVLRDGLRALFHLYEDFEVVGEASEGKEAVQKAQELHPDVVIMDLVMPVMDGLEATRRITRGDPKAKVLVLTQHDDKEYILSAIKAGAAGYVVKRALGSELMSAVRTVYQGNSFLYPLAASVLIEDYRHRAEGDAQERLTAREREILKLLAEGHSSQEIAEALVISPRTVLGHRTRIMEKLGLHNRAELLKYALRKRLVSIDA